MHSAVHTSQEKTDAYHSRAPDRCANAARGAVHSRRDGANSTNVPPGSIPASRADRCCPHHCQLLLLLRHHHHHLPLPHHSRGDARGHEDVVGAAVAADAVAVAAVEVNAAEIAVVVASVVVAAVADVVVVVGALTRRTARTSRMLAFELG